MPAVRVTEEHYRLLEIYAIKRSNEEMRLYSRVQILEEILNESKIMDLKTEDTNEDEN